MGHSNGHILSFQALRHKLPWNIRPPVCSTTEEHFHLLHYFPPPQIFNFKPQNDIKSMYVYKSHILLSQTFHLGFGITIVQWPS